MSTRRRLLGIEEDEEKVSEVLQLTPNFKRTLVDTDGRTFLENYDFSSIESDSEIIPSQSIPLVLAVDAFMDSNHVLSRIDLNRLREENPETVQIILESIKSLNEYILKEEDINSEIVDVRVALVDHDIRRTSERLCEDVRAWTGINVPLRYKSSEIRLGIHSVDIKRALDVNGQETTQGPEYISRVTLYMYSTTSYDLDLIIAGKD